MLVGCYVGFATVGIFVAWYMYPSVLGLDLSHDGHTPVTYSQLSNWEECPTWAGFQVTLCRRVVAFSPALSHLQHLHCSEGTAQARLSSLGMAFLIRLRPELVQRLIIAVAMVQCD